MNNEQIVDELDSLLTLLNEHQKEIDAIHEKFQVALTGVLRLIGESTPTLTKLQGKTEDLTGYLISLNTDVIETTTKSYQSLRKRIEEVIELATLSDRKS
ncbi:MAG: hypothetical protein ACTSYJ_10035 [Candidatus Thorarchaeota archaeon]|nr:MAG: hypothetical protein DRP42_07035 [Mycoplasmatota bacterium]